MTDNYVICKRDNETNSLVYYTGTTTFYGDLYYGDVLEAKRFSDLQEVAELIAKPSSNFYLGFNVINIGDVTFEKLAESKKTDKNLYNKFHDPNYAIR